MFLISIVAIVVSMVLWTSRAGKVETFGYVFHGEYLRKSKENKNIQIRKNLVGEYVLYAICF